MLHALLLVASFGLGISQALAGTEPVKPALTNSASYTGEAFRDLTGGARRGVACEGLLTISLDGDLAKLAGWKGSRFHLSAIDPHGTSPTQRYVHDVNGISNIDAYDTPRLEEAWVEIEPASSLNLRLGQLLADTEFFTADTAALFLNSGFGAPPVVSLNFPAPDYPVAAPGIRARYSRGDAFSLQAALFTGNPGDPAIDNHHGVHWQLGRDDGLLALLEAAWKPACRCLHSSTVKAGLFYHTGGHNLPPTAGGYALLDQPIWSPASRCDASDGLHGFVRLAAAPIENPAAPLYADAGLNFKGPLAGRGNDVAGLAASTTLLQDQRTHRGEGPYAHPQETVFEATYKAVLHTRFSLQPDVQYILHPGGDRLHNALVAGIRGVLTFP
jgi:porin